MEIEFTFHLIKKKNLSGVSTWWEVRFVFPMGEVRGELASARRLARDKEAAPSTFQVVTSYSGQLGALLFLVIFTSVKIRCKWITFKVD